MGFSDLLSKVFRNLRHDVDKAKWSSDCDCYDAQGTGSRISVISKCSDSSDDSKYSPQSSHKSKCPDYHAQHSASKTCNLSLYQEVGHVERKERFGILKDSSKTENNEDECTGTSQHHNDVGLNKSEELHFEIMDETKVVVQFTAEVNHQSVETVVCYGLGNFSDCIIARYQLALLILICGFLKVCWDKTFQFVSPLCYLTRV